jgi:hypothetical protein
MVAASRATCRSQNTSRAKRHDRGVSCFIASGFAVTEVEDEHYMTAYLISLALATLVVIALCEAFE